MAEPKCIYFGKCGGCATQHLDYSVQLDNKKKRLSEAAQFAEVQAFSGDPYGYRTRMDPVFTAVGLGFREKGKWHKKVDVHQCDISNNKLNILLKEVRDYFQDPDSFDSRSHAGTLRYAVIRTPQNDSSISFVVNKESSRVGDAIDKVQAFSRQSSANNILVTYMAPKTDMSIGSEYVVIKGSDMLKESFLGKTFWYSAQGFFQNNHQMAEEMHKYVNSLLQKYDTQKAHLLDLYGGVGTFGIINADLFETVTTLESFKGCTDAAELNIKENNVTNVDAICKDAKLLKNISLPKPLYVITDPPRSGMHPKTIQALNNMKPEVIVYISCNIKQLEKDLSKFTDYKIKSVALFDLFPQTNHMESVVELWRG